MSAVVFIEVVQPGDEAERIVATIKDSVPVVYTVVAGTDRIEVIQQSRPRRRRSPRLAGEGDLLHSATKPVISSGSFTQTPSADPPAIGIHPRNRAGHDGLRRPSYSTEAPRPGGAS